MPEGGFIKWIKKPVNIALLVLIFITLIIRIKFMFQPSLWVDESHYMLFGSKIASNPFGLLGKGLINNVQFPGLIIGILSIFFSAFTAGRIMALFFVLAGVLASFGIGKELNNEYVGSFAAVLLIFNPLHWFIGSRALVDVPVASMVAVFIYALIRLSKYKRKIDLMWVGLAAIGAILSKATGMVVVLSGIVYGVYYFLIAPRFDKSVGKISFGSIFKNKWTWVILGLLVFVGVRQWQGLVLGVLENITPRTDGLNLIPFVLTGNAVNIGLTFIFLVVLLHVVYCIAFKKHEQLILPVSFVLFAGMFAILPGGIEPRYLLPLATPFYLMFGILIIEIIMFLGMIAKTKKYNYLKIGILVLLIILLVPKMYAAGNSLIIGKYYSYTGYDKAGEWLAENVEDDAVLLTMSGSWAVMFTGFETLHTGGKIGNTAFSSPEEFITWVNNTDRPVYVVFDIWQSWAQPQWLTEWMQPPGKFGELGFNIVRVEEEYYLNDASRTQVMHELSLFGDIPTGGAGKVPAIIIFKRE